VHDGQRQRRPRRLGARVFALIIIAIRIVDGM
jgi:hypothetical protein